MEDSMSVKIRERVYPETNTVTWQADIHVKLIDGRKIRERSKIPGATSHSAALKWARERERWLILHGHEKEDEEDQDAAAENPTLARFSERFIAEYVLANRLKPSTVYNRKKIIRTYLLPSLGHRRLDEIGEAEIQKLKATYADHSAYHVNMMLDVLGLMLRVAVDWGVIPSLLKIRKLKISDRSFAFYDDDTYRRLIESAAEVDQRSLLTVLLGGDAGLRGGEIAALRLVHCDVDRGVLNVAENDWCGQVGLPKSNRTRQVVMTSRLRALLREIKRQRDDHEARLITRTNADSGVGYKTILSLLQRAQQAAGLPLTGTHILRHTFCSRLAARGAAPRAIQELAGHANSSTTDRYMHLAPGALRTAIALIES
jgi:integrase